MNDKALTKSKHRHAERSLVGFSFMESLIFPTPPAVMLAPIALAQPAKTRRHGNLITIASELGGVFGYLLGWGTVTLFGVLYYIYG